MVTVQKSDIVAEETYWSWQCHAHSKECASYHYCNDSFASHTGAKVVSHVGEQVVSCWQKVEYYEAAKPYRDTTSLQLL